ncbi:MAG: cytosolic protein, partial [Chloroflexota bacterium]
MADQETVRGLLRGAFDMHVHSAPDVLSRKFNDVELARRTIAAGMAGFVLKSHYICTADRATLIRTLFPEVQAFGGLTLNNSVGGLNPIAVDIAGRLGNKVVWLPTVDSANELANVAGQLDESKLSYWMPIA